MIRHEKIFDYGTEFCKQRGGYMNLCTGAMVKVFGKLPKKFRVVLSGRPMLGSKEVKFNQNMVGMVGGFLATKITIKGQKHHLLTSETARFVKQHNLLGKRCYVKIEKVRRNPLDILLR